MTQYTCRPRITQVDTLLDDVPDLGIPLDMVDHQAENEQRAAFAAIAVAAYAARTHQSGEPLGTVIGDLLSDLRHLCDAILDAEDDDPAETLNFEYLAGRTIHYDAEILGVL